MNALDKFKYEVASEVGVNLKEGYNGDISSRDAGRIGGNMVKKLVLTIAKEIGANKYYISGNGSVLYDMKKNEILYENYLNKEKVLEIIELCEKNSIYYNIYTESSVIAKSLNYNVAFYNYENTKKSSDKKTEINIVEDVYDYVKKLNTNKFLKMTICDESKIVFSSRLCRSGRCR